MNFRTRHLLWVVALSAGCITGNATKPSGGSPQLRAQVKELAQKAEALLRAQDERVWKGWTTGAPIDITKTYETEPTLFSLESVRAIEQLRADILEQSEALEADGGSSSTSERELLRELRALTHLKVHFAGEVLARSLAVHTDAVSQLEASMTFPVDGKEYSFRDLDRLVANERSAPKRRALHAGATASVERLNQSLRRKHSETQALLSQLGYASHEAFGSELRQANLDRMAQEAERILQVTQPIYIKAMDALSRRELQLGWSDVRLADIPRLFLSKSQDNAFTKPSILPRANETLRGLGVDISASKNIRVDAQETPNKNARTLVLPVRIPDDVRLSFRPSGGLRDQSILLHELGHALHFAFTTEKRFELSKLGNSTVSETYGQLFEDLLEDPVWLEQKAGLSGTQLAELLEGAGARRLFLVRHAAGKLLYEIQLHRLAEGGAEAKALFKTIFERALGLPFSPDDEVRYLVEDNDFYASADRLRSWMLASQLQAQLKARFGPTWWTRADAGTYLKGLWAHGNALSPQEIAQTSGSGNLNADALLLRISAALKVPVSLSPSPAQLTTDARAVDAGTP